MSAPVTGELTNQDALPTYPSSCECTDGVPDQSNHADRQYNLFNLVFSWFALANLWLTFSIVIELVPTSVKINLFVTPDAVS